MELLPVLNGFEIPRGKRRAGPLLSEQISLLQQATSCYAWMGGVLRVGTANTASRDTSGDETIARQTQGVNRIPQPVLLLRHRARLRMEPPPRLMSLDEIDRRPGWYLFFRSAQSALRRCARLSLRLSVQNRLARITENGLGLACNPQRHHARGADTCPLLLPLAHAMSIIGQTV